MSVVVCIIKNMFPEFNNKHLIYTRGNKNIMCTRGTNATTVMVRYGEGAASLFAMA